jgi:hypothetical protein
MKIHVSYSFGYEVSRIFEAGQIIDWYNQHGYKLSLPKGITHENIASLSKEEIAVLLKGEFREDLYHAAKHELMGAVEKYMLRFSEKLTELNLPIQDEYTVTLTRYGTGGSYQAPRTVIMNIEGKFGIGPIKTVMHEITHTLIQPYIEQYNVEHWAKEHLVDLIMARVAPFSPPVMQQVPEQISKRVDDAFEKYYPDIEKIAQEIGV